VFTATMTGNTVLLGLALIQADHQEALRASLALVGFLGGGALGAWVVEQGPAAGRWPRTVTVALALEWGILWVFALGWLSTGGEAATFAARGPLIGLSALAMGVQSAAARRLEVSGIATTSITGTVMMLAAWLMRWLGGGGATVSTRPQAGMPNVDVSRQARRAVGLLAAVWGIYVGGAMVAGGLGAPRPGVGRGLPARAPADRHGHRGGSLAAVTGEFSYGSSPECIRSHPYPDVVYYTSHM
jgi:uncharacterized membrane protein YoaK (UPF0700 family)